MSSIFRRISDASQRLASNIYSGAQRVATAVIPESVRRRVSGFTNWLTRNVPEEQIPKDLDEVVRNVRERYPPRPPRGRPRVNFNLRQEQSAFQNFVTQYVIDGEEGWGPDNFLEAARQSITTHLRNKKNTKVMLSLYCKLKKATDHTIVVDRPFRSYHEFNFIESNEDEIYNLTVKRVLENLDSFMAEGSGWVFDSVISLTLFEAEFYPLDASSWIPLPVGLRNRKLINIQNKNDCYCFQYCAKSVEYPQEKNPQRVTKKLKEQIKELNMTGIESPVKLKDIDKFENQNPTFSVVVIGYDEKDGLYPLRRQRKETFNGEHLVILLLLTNEEGNSHYVLVKNPSVLIASELSKDEHKMFFLLELF